MATRLSLPARSCLFLAAVAIFCLSSATSCRGEELKSTTKSAARGDLSLAYSALPYIAWPRTSFDTDQSPFVIGVLGKTTDAHEKLLATYQDGKKQIHGRTVDIRQLDDDRDLSSCHALLFTQSCSREQVDRALKSVRGKSVLTIGETDDFTEAGGVLSVVKNGSESILELNQRAARRQQLKVDVRLVNVSVLIQER